MLDRILTHPATTFAVAVLLGVLLVLAVLTVGASFDEVAKGKGKDVTVGVVEKGKG